MRVNKRFELAEVDFESDRAKAEGIQHFITDGPWERLSLKSITLGTGQIVWRLTMKRDLGHDPEDLGA